MMKEIILGIWLVIQGAIDLKYKEIPLGFLVLGAVVGIGFCIVEKREIELIILSLLPGLIFVVFSWLTREAVGYGDGLVFLVMGIYLSLQQIVSVGMLAFSLATVVALFLLVFLQKKGSYRIPFLPFLSIAYVISCWTQIRGN